MTVMKQGWELGMAMAIGGLSWVMVACQGATPTPTALQQVEAVSAVVEPEPDQTQMEAEAVSPDTIIGTVQQLPRGNQLGRLRGIWQVDEVRVLVNDGTAIDLETVAVGDTVQVSGLQVTESFLIAVAILGAANLIELDRTVPAQSAGRFAISVQLPPPQLTTPEFIIPALDPEVEDATFVRSSLELFPGFTSYSANAASAFTIVEFDQLLIEAVDSDECVIVHNPGADPLVASNQLAKSIGCP